jgi:hypothetical protein
MIIFLRQSEIGIGTKDDQNLTLKQACFIKSRFIEIYPNGFEFCPHKWRDSVFIKRVNGDCWLEPFTGITYDFLFVYPSEKSHLFPKHLEILPVDNTNFYLKI